MAFVLDMVGCEWGASMQRHELVDHCNFRKYNQNYELRHSQKLHGNFTSFLRNLDLSEGAALDLVAVLAGGELLVVGLVLAGDESFGKPVKKKRAKLSTQPMHFSIKSMSNNYF